MTREEAFQKSWPPAKPMKTSTVTDADIVLAWLSATPGEWVADLYRKTRCMVHSRIADLRKRGFKIESKCFARGDYRYRLVSA